MKKTVGFCLMLVFVVILSSCAPGPNPNKDHPGHDGRVAGFLDGCWHGFIMPLAFIGTWFSDDVNIYEVHNNGFFYHLGLSMPGFVMMMIGMANARRIMEQQGYIR